MQTHKNIIFNEIKIKTHIGTVSYGIKYWKECICGNFGLLDDNYLHDDTECFTCEKTQHPGS